MTDSGPDTGVLYLRGDRRRVDTWVTHGSVPCFVVPLAGWTLVAPAGTLAAPPPYDGVPTVLASRGIPSGLRSAVGLFRIGGRAVVTVHPSGWRAVTRWLVWEPGRGTAVSTHLPSASPADLVRVAGVAVDVERDIRSLLADRSAAVPDLLGDLIGLLALPGERMVLGRGLKSAEGSTLVEPQARSVREYERIAMERKEIHDTLAEPS